MAQQLLHTKNYIRKFLRQDEKLKRIGVIGSRSFDDYKLLKNILSKFLPFKLVSGGAIGADLLAERFAIENNLLKEIFLPDWNKYGKRAGFIRNSLIVKNSDAIIAFWDGFSKGTKDTIEKARKKGKQLMIIDINKL